MRWCRGVAAILIAVGLVVGGCAATGTPGVAVATADGAYDIAVVRTELARQSARLSAIAAAQKEQLRLLRGLDGEGRAANASEAAGAPRGYAATTPSAGPAARDADVTAQLAAQRSDLAEIKRLIAALAAAPAASPAAQPLAAAPPDAAVASLREDVRRLADLTAAQAKSLDALTAATARLKARTAAPSETGDPGTRDSGRSRPDAAAAARRDARAAGARPASDGFAQCAAQCDATGEVRDELECRRDCRCKAECALVGDAAACQSFCVRQAP
ncbi:MAG: hypothetical protein NW205_08975 [Hyphomicrobiaceae bacterium]|nr:hypothetical protein [Hyphomicrobiaceae bacterium]